MQLRNRSVGRRFPDTESRRAGELGWARMTRNVPQFPKLYQKNGTATSEPKTVPRSRCARLGPTLSTASGEAKGACIRFLYLEEHAGFFCSRCVRIGPSRMLFISAVRIHFRSGPEPIPHDAQTRVETLGDSVLLRDPKPMDIRSEKATLDVVSACQKAT